MKNKKKLLAAALFFFLPFFIPQACLALTQSRYAFPSANTWIGISDRNANHSNDGNMLMGHGRLGADEKRILVRFDLQYIPREATITSAKMEMTQWSANDSATPTDVSIQRIADDWSVYSVNWNNKPGVFSLNLARLTTRGGGGGSNKIWKWDVTQTVKNWMNGSYPNYGFMISCSSNAIHDYSFFKWNRYTEASLYPRLDIEYTLPDPYNTNTPFFRIDPYNFLNNIPLQNFSFTGSQITSLRAEEITSRSAKIAWETHDALVGCIAYGQSTAYSDRDCKQEQKTVHEYPLEGLSPSTTYHYSAFVISQSGSYDVSEDQTFTTLPTSSSGNSNNQEEDSSDSDESSDVGDSESRSSGNSSGSSGSSSKSSGDENSGDYSSEKNINSQSNNSSQSPSTEENPSSQYDRQKEYLSLQGIDIPPFVGKNGGEKESWQQKMFLWLFMLPPLVSMAVKVVLFLFIISIIIIIVAALSRPSKVKNND